MKLHSLISIQKKSQRIGRSGKRGSYSGRGVKGQRSRSGHRIRPAERDLIIRLPKLRGFRNKAKDDAEEVFNVGTLSTKLKSSVKSGTPLEVSKALLKSLRMLKKDFRGEVKILGTGEMAFPIIVKDLTVSGSAKMKIEKVGGKVQA